MTPWKLRPSQLRAYKAMLGNTRVIANMPTGWGKSFLLCCVAANDLLQKNRKVIICVPQRIIAKGFVQRKKIQLPSNKVVEWHISTNLCDESPEKVAQLLDFISGPAGVRPEDRVILCTHTSLAIAFQKLSDDEIGKCFQRTTMIIDEAHHIQASEFGANRLGQVISSILDLNDRTTKVLLATAYFFRGDHLPIIGESHLRRFFQYHIPFDEYWGGLKYVKTYSYDFVTYKGTVFKELRSLLQRSQEPTIIYCPPEGHKMLLGKDKESFVGQVRSACASQLSAKIWTTGTVPHDGNKVIVDLVDTKNRLDKIEFVARHGDKVAAVLTVGMFREGADWVEAARIIDLVPTGSDQDRLQRFGRLVRDCSGKKHVSYFSFFSFVVEDDEEDRRKELSKLYAHFHASMILENAIHPIKIKIGLKAETDSENGTQGNRLDLLGQLSEHTQESVIRESFDELVRLQVEKAKTGLSVSPDQAKHVVVQVLKANGVKRHLEPTAKQVMLVIRRKSNVQLNTDDLVAAGFDKVWSTDIFDGLIAYSAGVGGPTTLEEIRQVIDGVFEQQWSEHFEKIKQLPCPPSSHSSAYWWCTHNKVLHGQKKLHAKKERLLNSISWWNWQERFEDRWQTRFDEISQLPSCPKAGTRQYDWVRQQRRLYEEEKLEPYKVVSLKQILWWKWATLAKNWESTYQSIAALDVPPGRGTKEYEWCRTQRKLHGKGKLSEDRRRHLEAISWWNWTERRADRTEGLEELKRLIGDGMTLGYSKAKVRNLWAHLLGIGNDQIHKYLRKLPKTYRDQWDRLADDRGKRKTSPSKEPA